MLYRLFFVVLFITVTISAQDHSEFIEGPFEQPQEVTETCLTCHDYVAEEVMTSRHWNWMTSNEAIEKGALPLGKKNMINNFCIAVPSNWPRCTSCHISYGWKDESFDFTDENNIDCLVCHDQSGKYVKTPTGAGMPGSKVDLEKVAQSVGLPTRANCGTCHFDGGGGTGVKHGDLDESLLSPEPETDVHMGMLDFSCTDCHETTGHKIAGASHGSMGSGGDHFSCQKCHGDEVHESKTLNKHIANVACETCHVPVFAKEQPTKVWWDWSKAGEDRESEPDEYGKEIYNKKKGEFKWAMNVTPEYTWNNGKADYYQLGEKIDPSQTVELNKLEGNIKDKNAKISPFKVMRGKQPYDAKNNYLIVPKLYGEDGYWKTFDWKLAAEKGMEAVNQEFSGEVGFVETAMYWPINHMVSPASEAIKCTRCHGVKGEKLLDWKALGYPGDPMRTGGRKKLRIISK